MRISYMLVPGLVSKNRRELKYLNIIHEIITYTGADTTKILAPPERDGKPGRKPGLTNLETYSKSLCAYFIHPLVVADKTINLTEAAGLIGSCSHSSICTGRKFIKDLLDVDSQVQHDVGVLKKRLEGIL